MENVNNFNNMRLGFEREMKMKIEDKPELFLQYYQAKMLDGIFNELSNLQSITQKLNWINDSIRDFNKNKNILNGEQAI